jgi:hypothetical protein
MAAVGPPRTVTGLFRIRAPVQYCAYLYTTFIELVYRGFEQVFNLKILASDLTGIPFNAMIYDYLSCIGVSA